MLVAPRLQRRFGTAPTLAVNLALMATVMLTIAAFADAPRVLVAATIVAGAFIGINNTLTTQAVMSVAPVERPVASAAYGFVRFIGGGLAPFVAGHLAERWGVALPFTVGAAAFLLAIGVLALGRRELAAAEAPVLHVAAARPAPAQQPAAA